MSSPTYSLGDIVPWRMTPGTILASFFVSILGTFLCIELLERKRLGSGLISRVQLLSSAAILGLSIWCMHFVGNYSIVLGDGSPGLQLVYSPGWTLLSCVLPIIGLTLAFYVSQLHIRRVLWRRSLDVCSGFLAGISIVCMHYVGNLGTRNYDLIYALRYVAAATIIAISDSVIAFVLFFYFKDRWMSSLWKRLLCAILLSIGVCGMHYTASVGCTYRLRHVQTSHSRDLAVIIVPALYSSVSVAAIFGLAYTAIRRRASRRRARQVMLACAFFDDLGSIMVTREGCLPSKMVARNFHVRAFDEALDDAHPLFLWMWKASHDWDAIRDCLQTMRAHFVHAAPQAVDTTSYISDRDGAMADEESHDNLWFRQGFCVAAAALADHLRLDLAELGGLYDQVIVTSTLPSTAPLLNIRPTTRSSVNVECGQLLLFVRKLGRSEANVLVAQGLKFAPLYHIRPRLANMMQIPLDAVGHRIESLRNFADTSVAEQTPKQGTYFVCFTLLSRSDAQFDVLVQQANRELLPDIQLAPRHLDSETIANLAYYNHWSVGNMIQHLRQKRSEESSAEVCSFLIQVTSSLLSLRHTVSGDWFSSLMFHASPIINRYGGPPDAAPTMIFALTRVLNGGRLKSQTDGFTFVPLDLLRLRTSFLPGSQSMTNFRAETRIEFASLANRLNIPSHDAHASRVSSSSACTLGTSTAPQADASQDDKTSSIGTSPSSRYEPAANKNDHISVARRLGDIPTCPPDNSRRNAHSASGKKNEAGRAQAIELEHFSSGMRAMTRASSQQSDRDCTYVDALLRLALTHRFLIPAEAKLAL